MTLVIIQARLGSTRFPRKALALLNGLPVIQHVIHRVYQIGAVGIVLAVPPSDEKEFQGLGVPVKAPHVAAGDVLGRFAAVATLHPQADTIMRITGDCPVLDPKACARLLRTYQRGGCDYAWIDTRAGTGWADGLDCEVFSREMLLWADESATDPVDREHVTPIMRRGGIVLSIPPCAHDDWPKVSIDTPEDLARVEAWMQQH